MTNLNNPLKRVRVAAPCTADWERMSGDERVRFCGQCSLNVYNLSDMSRREAEALIMSAERRICVRFYRRADGTILTNNCPVGLRALKRRVSRVGNVLLSSALGFFAGLGFNLALNSGGENFKPSGEQVMGDIVAQLPAPVVKPVLDEQMDEVVGKLRIPAKKLGINHTRRDGNTKRVR